MLKKKVQSVFSILKSESNAQYHFENSKDLFKNLLMFAVYFPSR